MNIYVGNLPLEMTEEELRGEFTNFGAVTAVTIMNDKYIGSGQPRCYGYVEMSLKSEGTIAINNLNGKKVHDRVVDVVEALPLSDKRSAERLSAKNNPRSNKSRQRKFMAV
jgi:RNA recognition motif-containing protein